MTRLLNPIDRFVVALWYIQTVRLTVYPSPLLARGGSQSSTVGSEKAKMEQGRRMADRILFEALSRYYRLEQGVAAWNRPLLLKKGKQGHDHSSH